MSLFLVLLLETRLFYLVPNDILGIKFEDLRVFFEFFLFAITFIKYKFKIPYSKYNRYIFCGIGLIISSAIAGFLTYGQDIILGLNVQRLRLATLLMFFVMVAWEKQNKISYTGVTSLIATFAKVYLFICVCQYLVQDYIIFTYTFDEASFRFGKIRFRFNDLYFAFFLGFLLDDIQKKIDTKKLFLALLLFLFFFKISMTRMTVITVVVATASFFVFCGKRRKIKVLGICTIVIALFLSINSDIYDNFIGLYSGKNTREPDTVVARDLSRAYYIKKTVETNHSILIGCGAASANNALALNSTYPQIYSSEYGYAIKYFPQDNGIVASFYFYGLVGIIWWLWISGRIFIDAKHVFKKKRIYLFLFLLLMDFVGFVTKIPTPLQTYMIMPLNLFLLNVQDRECKGDIVCKK